MVGECANCGNHSNLYEHHIVPKSVGGTERVSNKAYLCEQCHGLIHDKQSVGLSTLTKAALAHKRAQGEAYSTTPFGYTRKGKMLLSNPEEQQVLHTIRELRAAKKSYSSIASHLNSAGILTKQAREGKKSSKWYASTVHYIINSGDHPDQ